MSELEKTIFQLEERLLLPEVRKNRDRINQLLAPEFEELGSNGKLNSRDAVLDWLLNHELDTRWQLSQFRIRQLTSDIVLAIYHAKKIQIDSAQSHGSMRSSLWRCVNNEWKMIFHQGSKII
ncbi:MAG: DUF4440 domain-containing protein [Gammaproteobacteria bacterium]|nr:DUF4440 domain-containing protein [Gammaproteobacteria bacterium]